MSFTQNIAPTFPKQPNNGIVQIANADASNQKTVYTAGGSGSKIVALIATSTETANGRDIQVSITNGGTSYLLGTVTVPLNSGFAAGVPAVNLLDPSVIVGLAVDSDGNPFLYLKSGDTLTVSSLTTVASGKLITVVALAADF